MVEFLAGPLNEALHEHDEGVLAVEFVAELGEFATVDVAPLVAVAFRKQHLS